MNLLPIFAAARDARAFPGGTAFLGRAATTLAHQAGGFITYDEAAPRVHLETLYDLASLSKLFTLSALLIAMREASVEVEAPLHQFLSLFDTPDKREITLRHLLRHNSGIEIGIQRLTQVPVEDWTRHIVDAPLKSAIGERVSYCCSNYFLLARVIEVLASQPFHRFLEQRVFEPLQMRHTTFEPRAHFALNDIAPTEIDAETGQAWHGVVHDEAARAYFEQTGGACGNSGIFSTAGDLAHFCRLWLDEGAHEGHQLLHPDDVRRALTDAVPEKRVRRAWSWQLDDATWMSTRAPQESAGHTGFTGPTLFISPRTQYFAIVLENRVHPTRNGPHRMNFHRQIAEVLFDADKHPN